jgi:hypothetical protein
MIMKKTTFLAAALVSILMLTTSCDSEKAIPVEQLPAPAKTFIEKTYPGSDIVLVKKETEWFVTEYKAYLDSGMEVKFDSDGLPLDIDMD